MSDGLQHMELRNKRKMRNKAYLIRLIRFFRNCWMEFIEMISYLEIAKKALINNNGSGQEMSKTKCIRTRFWEPSEILEWACRVAEADITLAQPIKYSEARLCTVVTTQISKYATMYLRTITSARVQRESGGWGLWTPEWWQKREDEAFEALSKLRQAMIERGDTDK